MWELSERLRKNGVDCRIDQHEESPAEGWPRWCRNQVQAAQFVLVACTETYQRRYEGKEEAGKGLGGQWEGFVITQELYDAEGKNTKFVPLLFSPGDRPYIPLELHGATHYDLSEPDGYEKLLRRVLNRPLRKAGDIGEAPPLPPRERKTAPLSQVFTVPFPPNPFFTGRKEELDGLQKTLDASGIAALTGLGGVGKTQTAAHYAHQHRQDYPYVLWVRAESAEALFVDLTQLAQRLELPEREAKEQSVIVEAMLRWLDRQGRWLLVLDNVEDFAVIRELARMANADGRHIIITTQQRAMGGIGKQRLTPMEQEQGAELLLLRAGRISGFEQKAGPSAHPARSGERAGLGRDDSLMLLGADANQLAPARQISEEVGGLPLALDQAGAYIEETGCGLDDYLTLLKQRFDELAKRRGGLDSDHLSVAATFETSIEKLGKPKDPKDRSGPAAAELLNAAAFLPPDAIPEEVFTEGAAQFGPVLQAAASDALKWNEAIGAAFKFSLLERNPQKKTLAVHRMVQAVARSRMSAEERRSWAEQLVRAVDAAFPYVEFAVWDKCERLTPSAQACAALVDEYQLSSTEAARLLNQAGYYLWHRARYAEAEPLYRRALAISEKSLGADHPTVAIRLNNLAELLRVTNRLAEAEPLMRRALAINEKALGPDHPTVAINLNVLSLMLQDTNRLGEAEPLMRRALAIGEKTLGPDHPSVATRLNNLARLLQDTNRLAEAEPLMRRAIEIFEKAYGADHPNVATSLNNLATLLYDTNRLGEAEPLMRRALAINQESLGPEHPSTVTVRNNLAALLRQMGKSAEADKL